MKERKCKKKHDQDKDYIQAIISCLVEGPLSFQEIMDQFKGMMARFGVFEHQVQHWNDKKTDFVQELREQLLAIEEMGWIILQNDKYELTDEGRKEAEMALVDIRRIGRFIKGAMSPRTVSKITWGFYMCLGILKLPVGIISGSAGLINDAVSTLQHAVSSIIVHVGVRRKHEKMANVVLVIMMVVTGFFTFYIAMQGFFFPGELKWRLLALIVSFLSILFFTLLSLYQRFIGKRTGNLSLITQSVDSLARVSVSVGVIVGTIVTMFGIPYLDALVGLIVAIFILKTAVELSWNLFNIDEEMMPDMQRYNMFIVEKVERWQEKHFLLWLLYLIDKQKMNTQETLLQECVKSMDYSKNVILREINLSHSIDINEKFEIAINKLLKSEWIVETDILELTDSGKEQLKSWT